jgi:hypothetical protein
MDGDHSGHPRRDQRVGRRAIKVKLVKDNDVACADSSKQVTSAAVDPCHAGDPGLALVGSIEQSGKLHTSDRDKWTVHCAHATPGSPDCHPRV